MGDIDYHELCQHNVVEVNFTGCFSGCIIISLMRIKQFGPGTQDGFGARIQKQADLVTCLTAITDGGSAGYIRKIETCFNTQAKGGMRLFFWLGGFCGRTVLLAKSKSRENDQHKRIYMFHINFFKSY